MTSVDHLFKKPLAPSQKRKLEAPKDPNELYKSVKLNRNGDARSSKESTVEDEMEDAAAGPELPPDLEEDGEDEEGRFFGGGVSRNTADLLDYVNKQDKDTQLESIDIPWLRKTALSFEKKINKNAELRAKFEGDPQKFVGSEADLDADIKALSILSEHPELYPEFARLGSVNSLVSLLSHENTDIAIDAIEIISELTDEDVEAEQEQWDTLVDALLEADILGLLLDNSTRFNEDLESDRSGVYHVLGVLESLASKATVADKIGEHASIIPWLLSRSARKEAIVSQNKQYAAEVLAILLQSSCTCQDHLIRIDGIDALLQSLSPYRKRDPAKGTEEEEYVENLFSALTCLADIPAGKDALLAAEGIELALLMIKDGKLSRSRALRLLDHTLSGIAGASACAHTVEAAGLKPLFTLFMKKPDTQSTEHLLGIFASMLRSLPSESAPRIRLLGKFCEKDYEKIQRLLQLRRDCAARLAAVDADIAAERRALKDKALAPAEEEEQAATFLSRRLDAGLFALQTLDTVLAWLVAEDDGARRTIVEMLAERDEGLDVVRATLEEQLKGLADGEGEDGGSGGGGGDGGGAEGGDEDEKMARDMLRTLVGFLA